MRFFVTFLVLTLSLAVSASVPDVKEAENRLVQLKSELSHFEKISEDMAICKEINDSNPKRQDHEIHNCQQYERTRPRMLRLGKSFIDATSKCLEKYYAEKSLEIVEQLYGYSEYYYLQFHEEKLTLIHNFPKTSPKNKQEIVDSVTNAEASIAWIGDHFKDLKIYMGKNTTQ